MLNTSDFESVNQVSQILRAMTDRMCGNELNSEIAAHLTSYAKLLLFVSRAITSDLWKEGNSLQLQETIVRFKQPYK